MKRPIRILLVADHELVRRGLRCMLEPEEDVEVVDDCASAEEVFSRLQMLSPDIVLMDTHMPGIDGIEAIRSLKRRGSDYDGDVIILAESADCRAKALQAGAAGYLLKDVTGPELAQAIREVYWSKQSPENRGGFAERVVELVVPPPANAAWLLRFMCELEEKLQDNYASIMYTVGSWDLGTVITIWLYPTRLSSLLDKLGNMPEVEKVEEEQLARGGFPSFLKKFGLLPRSSISPSKRIHVTLKESDIVMQ